jgi:mono/diheme cytochrome c family protein
MMVPLRSFLGLATAAGLALALAPQGALAADAAAGKAKFDIFCASCHGATGAGDGPVAAAANPPPRNFQKGEFKFDTNKDGKPGTDADLKDVISNGAGKYGGNQLMAPWGGTLSGADLDNVVAYVRSLKK